MPRSGNKNKKTARQKKTPRLPKTDIIDNKPPSKKQMKKEIAAAVNSLPELVAKKVNLNNTPYELPAATQAEHKKNYTASRQPPRYSSILLWTGVILITAVIFIMWFFNTKALFSDFTQSDYRDSGLWTTATDDLDKIIDSVSQKNNKIANPIDNLQVEYQKEIEEKENIAATTKEKIKSILSALIIAGAESDTATITEKTED